MKPSPLILCFSLVFAVLLASCSTGSKIPEPGTKWIKDFDIAKSQAREYNRPILVNFTGSDWCGWCMKLSSEVFRTREFKDWAAAEVILLEIDFPRDLYQPKWLKDQNEALKNRYEVRGFPTILFLTPYGEVMGRSGYLEGGPVGWIAHAKAQMRD